MLPARLYPPQIITCDAPLSPPVNRASLQSLPPKVSIPQLSYPSSTHPLPGAVTRSPRSARPTEWYRIQTAAASDAKCAGEGRSKMMHTTWRMLSRSPSPQVPLQHGLLQHLSAPAQPGHVSNFARTLAGQKRRRHPPAPLWCTPCYLAPSAVTHLCEFVVSRFSLQLFHSTSCLYSSTFEVSIIHLGE